MIHKDEKGQALVLVLLSLAVVLTLVLFILARSVTDVAVSSSQENSVRAFSAAEAGIENALVIGKGTAGSANNSNYTAVVSGYSQGLSDFPYPVPLLSGDTATTWFVAHDETTGNIVCDQNRPCFSGSSMKVCWGNPGAYPNPQFIPAVEVSVYYETTPEDASTVRIARAVYDPNPSRVSSNSFSAPDAGTCTIGGTNYEFQKVVQFGVGGLGIPATSYNAANGYGLLFARIRMFYNTDVGQPLGTSVVGNTTPSLPAQGQSIISTGTAGLSSDITGQVTRRINVFQSWPESPFGGDVLTVAPSLGISQ